MKLKHIEMCLSSMQRDFPNPKVVLEQYPTSAELAASVVRMGLDNEDLGPERIVMDLGCGTGMLALGCAVVGCDHVIGVDCDEEALEVAYENTTQLKDDDGVDFVLAKIKSPNTKNKHNNNNNRKNKQSRRQQQQQPRSKQSLLYDKNYHDGLPFRDDCVDTVIMNPPFGTKHNSGMDVVFLRTAVRLARRCVYSFHKTSTRDYLLQTAIPSFTKPCQARVMAQMKFDIPQMYKFHTQKNVDVAVDLIRITIMHEEDDEQTTKHDGSE